MTDIRELLELAARAMGNSVHKFETWQGTELVFGAYVRNPEGEIFLWLPHGDDGENSRMRSALGICTNWIWYVMNGEHKCVGVECSSPFSRAIDVYLKDYNNDRNAALRLCALRVAAEIGRGVR